MERSVARLMISSLNLRVSWKLVNPQECVWKNLPKKHEDHIAGKGTNSLQHYNLVHDFSIASRNEDTRSRSSSRWRIWEKLEKIPADITKVKQNKGARWSKYEGPKNSYYFTNWHLSVEECRIGDKAPKIQWPSCAPKRHCEKWCWILCSFCRTRNTSITNDSSKSHRYHIQIANVRRTSTWRSISFFQGTNGRYSKIIENSKEEMSSHVDSSTTTQMAEIMVEYGRTSRSFWTTSVMSSFGRTFMVKAI